MPATLRNKSSDTLIAELSQLTNERARRSFLAQHSKALIRLEVVESVDPVRTGDETVYIVRVTNTGTAADRNLKLECELPPGLRLENEIVVY